MTTTAQTFEEYCALHLPQRIMEAGLGVRPEENYMEVPEEPERDVTVYVVSAASYSSHSDLRFLDKETAIMVASLKNVGKSYADVISFDEPVKVALEKVWSQEAYVKHRGVLELISKARDHNRRIREDVDAYDKKKAEIESAIFTEWSDIEVERRATQRIRDTYADYLKTAQGNADIAFEFLAKAFPYRGSSKLRKIVG